MNIKQKIVGTVATIAMAAAVFAPSAFATTTVTIKNNAPFSNNGAAVFTVNSSKVKQTNATVVNTYVSSSTNTGGNSASFNTGKGSNTITTGGSSTAAMVTVAGGTNTNTSTGCGCTTGDTTVDVSGNGPFSNNGVVVVNSNKNSVHQTNVTVVNTAVVSQTNTGGNSASFNTGGGDQSIVTGGSQTGASVSVTGSSNSN